MNEEKFTGKAELYEKYRPSYPDALVDFLYENARCGCVADIGAGTGKFTRCLMKKPWRVIAVEPNANMREKLADIDHIKIVAASAEDTGLADYSVGLVTVAQAFHWFDETRFRAECKRILAHDGQLAIIFNNRITEDCEISKVRDDICMRYCGAFHSGHIGKRTIEEGDAFLRNEYFSKTRYFATEHNMEMDEQSFIGDTLSRSYALNKDHPEYDRFVEELREAFSKYNDFGSVSIRIKTVCYLGKL